MFENLSFLIKGIGVGLAVAAPVGPVGIMCIRRSITYGRIHGFLAGIGAAAADSSYGLLAAFGLASISAFLTKERHEFQVIGGLLMIALGVKTYLSRPIESTATDRDRTGNFSAILTFFLLTIANPLSVLAFATIFAALGLVHPDTNYTRAIELGIGVFAGSTLWWFILSLLSSLIGRRLGPHHFQKLNKATGCVIAILGLGMIIF